MRILALAALALLLAGCGAPLAAQKEPDRPSEQVSVPPIPDLQGTLTVSSLPGDQRPSAPGAEDGVGLVNCFWVFSDSDALMAQVKAASITLAWQPESPVVGDLTLTVASDKEATASGGSPLGLEWTAADGGPAFMPFLVEVRAGPAAAQPVAFTIHVEGDGTALEAIQASCDG